MLSDLLIAGFTFSYLDSDCIPNFGFQKNQVIIMSKNYRITILYLDGKLEGIMNNTIEIQMIMGDSIIISNPCNCRRQNTSNSNNMNICVKYVRVNVCQDTVVAKSTINDSIR